MCDYIIFIHSMKLLILKRKKGKSAIRVAKCHGYDGLIRVKILASWGKSLGEHNFAKLSLFLKQICTIYMRFLCLNFTHWQNHQHLFSKNIPIANFGHFWCQNGRNLGALIRVKFGLKVLLRVKGLTFCNSVLQTQVKKPKTQLKSLLVGNMIVGSLNVGILKPSHDYPCWSLHFTSCWLFSLFKFQGRCERIFICF